MNDIELSTKVLYFLHITWLELGITIEYVVNSYYNIDVSIKCYTIGICMTEKQFLYDANVEIFYIFLQSVPGVT